MNIHTTLKASQRGAIFVLFAVTMPFLIAFSSLAVDMAYIYAEKEHMQNAVDAATLAGANNLKLNGSNDDAVKEIVQKYAAYNNENADTVPDSAIEIVHNTTDNYSTIRVVMTRDIPLHFMKYFLSPLGITTMQAAVTATGKSIPGTPKQDYDLKNSPLFHYSVFANSITKSVTDYNGSTKLLTYDQYYQKYGYYPGYYDGWGRWHTYSQSAYNNLRYAHNNSNQNPSITIHDSYVVNGTVYTYGSSRTSTTKLNMSLSSSNTDLSGLTTILNSLLPTAYQNSFFLNSTALSAMTSYISPESGVYYNMSTDTVNVGFTYKNNTYDNPESPSYDSGKTHEGGSVTIDGNDYTIIISNGDVNTMNIDNQNSMDATSEYSKPVILISLHGNVTIDEDTPHHHFNGIIYAPNGTATIKTPYDGSIIANSVVYAPYYWNGTLSPVKNDGNYYGINDIYKEYEKVYIGSEYSKGSTSLIK